MDYSHLNTLKKNKTFISFKLRRVHYEKTKM